MVNFLTGPNFLFIKKIHCIIELLRGWYYNLSTPSMILLCLLKTCSSQSVALLRVVVRGRPIFFSSFFLFSILIVRLSRLNEVGFFSIGIVLGPNQELNKGIRRPFLDGIGKSELRATKPASYHECIVVTTIHECVFRLVKEVVPRPQCFTPTLFHLNKNTLFFVGTQTPTKLVKNDRLRSSKEEINLLGSFLTNVQHYQLGLSKRLIT